MSRMNNDRSLVRKVGDVEAPISGRTADIHQLLIYIENMRFEGLPETAQRGCGLRVKGGSVDISATFIPGARTYELDRCNLSK
jgi:hypothetical protein